MCYIGYKHDGKQSVSCLHYRVGILDFAKYHEVNSERPEGGCECRAREGGYWQCNTDEACAAWVQHADECAGGFLDNIALFLDFDARHATVYNTMLTDWWNYLPDGWTHELVPADTGKERGKQ
jgi:hypothetical protein